MRGQIGELGAFRIEHMILSKPYFDPKGLILAVEDESDGKANGNDSRVASGRPLGFIHVGFGPSEDFSDVDTSHGIISMLKIVPTDRAKEIAEGLVAGALAYLKTKGSERVSAGSRFPFSPFYMGLYGGSEIPGVLQSDVNFTNAMHDNGFVVESQVAVLRRPLAGFRPKSGRDQISVRRKFQINIVVEPKEVSWWESCTLGMANRERFSIYHKQNQRVCGSVSFWDMQPLVGGTPATGRGMYGLNVPEEFRRSGIATFLVSEALKYYMQQGVEFVEAQALSSDSASIGVFEKLGFEEFSRGTLFHASL